jgi:hypothetical protein
LQKIIDAMNIAKSLITDEISKRGINWWYII